MTISLMCLFTLDSSVITLTKIRTPNGFVFSVSFGNISLFNILLKRARVTFFAHLFLNRIHLHLHPFTSSSSFYHQKSFHTPFCILLLHNPPHSINKWHCPSYRPSIVIPHSTGSLDPDALTLPNVYRKIFSLKKFRLDFWINQSIRFYKNKMSSRVK